jgi:hypothetical protein
MLWRCSLPLQCWTCILRSTCNHPTLVPVDSFCQPVHNFENEAQSFCTFRFWLGMFSHQFAMSSNDTQAIVEIVRQQAQSLR